MKIVVLQDYLRSGGTERQSLALAKTCREAGHVTTLMTFRPGGVLATELDGLHHVVLQPVDLGMDWFAPGLAPQMRALAPDVVVCMGRMANCYAGAVQRALPRAVVVGTMRTGKRLPALFRRSLGQVRHVVANSGEAARTLTEQYGVSAHKITVIHNALLREAAARTDNPALRAEVRARYGARPDTVVLLCVAMFRPEKNQRGLVEIAAHLPTEINWQLWLAGEGSELAACRELAARSPVRDRIQFPGYQADPTSLYAAADVAVLTSRSESLSNFLIEAHAHGLPSVAYRVGGVAECGGSVVEPGDKQHFLASVTTLLGDPAAREEAAERVRAYAREHFTAEHQQKLYLSLLERLARETGPSAPAS